MRCSRVRGALSAILDSASAGPHGGAALEHLESCDGCRRWLRDARAVNRRVRGGPSAPDLTSRVLAAVRADLGRGARTIDREPAAGAEGLPTRSLPAWVQGLRAVLAASALVQLALAVPTLLASHGPHQAVHVSREMASFDIAVAVAFLLVAWRPGRAAAYLPLALVLSAVLAATSALDVITDRAGALHELSHLITIGQAGLLALLARSVRRRQPPPPREADMPIRMAA